jgi:hypothetical protein
MGGRNADSCSTAARFFIVNIVWNLFLYCVGLLSEEGNDGDRLRFAVGGSFVSVAGIVRPVS